MHHKIFKKVPRLRTPGLRQCAIRNFEKEEDHAIRNFEEEEDPLSWGGIQKTYTEEMVTKLVLKEDFRKKKWRKSCT